MIIINCRKKWTIFSVCPSKIIITYIRIIYDISSSECIIMFCVCYVHNPRSCKQVMSSQKKSTQRQVSRGQSSVSARRKNSRKDSSNDDDIDLSVLHEGSMFLKFGRKGPVHERLITLSRDCRLLEWNSSWFKFKPKEDCQGNH